MWQNRLQLNISTFRTTLTHSSRMQHPCCITLSYRMSHPCVVRCLQTIAVLTVCMDKMVCHMIETKFPDRKFPGFPVLVNQGSLQMATSNMTHRQYFHVIFHVSRLILTADTTTVHGIAKINNMVHNKMCYC